jgi:hypothetical protein
VKYQYIIFAKGDDPKTQELEGFYGPVEDKDGIQVLCGPLRRDPNQTFEDLALGVLSYEDCPPEDTAWLGPLSDVPAPDGWQCVARAPIPDDYSPESREVLEEHRSRAIQHLKNLGVWKDK